jgi:RNA polymerase sigma factor (sigma-70 family)
VRAAAQRDNHFVERNRTGGCCVYTCVDVASPTPWVTLSRPTFADLYRSEYAKMVRVAWLIVGSSTVAEDLVQDAFVRVGRRYDRVREPSAYLRVAVINACRNELRRERKMSSSPLPEGVATDPSMIELLDAVAALDHRQRAAIVLRFVDDRSDDDIASILGVRRATVRSLVFRGLAELRKVVER